MPRFANKTLYLLSMVLVLLVALAACGGSTTEKLSDAVAPTESPVEETATLAAPTSEPTELPAVEPTEPPTAEPTEPPTAEPTEPPPTPVPEIEALVLTNHGFGQDGIVVGFAFIVENPNPGFAVEDSQYQLAVYDEAGTVVETDSGYINLILPGQALGIAGDLYLNEGVMAARMEVQLRDGDAVATEPLPAFTVESPTYYPSEYYASVTGIVKNPYDRTIGDLRVSAVLYNGAGEIIGGGFTYLNFLLANGSAGAKASVIGAGEVAEVELYPTLSSMSLLTGDSDLPEDASDLVLAQQGFGQHGSYVGFGMLVENPNDGRAVERSQYHITVFSQEGTVLETEEGYINILLPNQVLGVGGELILDEDATAASAEIEILSGDFVESEPLPLFSAENVAYKPDDYYPRVTGEIINPYSQDVTDLRVDSIGFDESGEIIGGGFSYLEFVPANGKAAAEVPMLSSDTPSRVELYATLSAMSEFEE